MTEDTSPDPQPEVNRRGWSSAYPVSNRDSLQKVVDPIVDCRLFSATIFGLIIYSMFNLYESYQAQTPIELDQIKKISFAVSAVFLLEFVLKFASRRFAYLKREGIIDFLAASDVFSPAIRATKFVRFLRVLRILRVIRGIKMVQKSRASRIEDNLFTSFSTATILVMLVFVSIKSHYDWKSTRNRVHERLIPILVSAEKLIETSPDDAEIALVEHPDFVTASHIPPSATEPDWVLAAKRELDLDRLREVVQDIEAQIKKARQTTNVSSGATSFLEQRVLRTLRQTTTPQMFQRVKRLLYLERQNVDADTFRNILGNALALMDTVPVHLSQVQPEDIPEHLRELRKHHFPAEFLTIRRENSSGTLVYCFLLDDEYSESREDEFTMLLATFALIIVMMLVLNFTVRDIIGPLGEIRQQTSDMADAGKLRPLVLSKQPENEISEIADNINRMADNQS